jgi:hypothetical protein
MLLPVRSERSGQSTGCDTGATARVGAAKVRSRAHCERDARRVGVSALPIRADVCRSVRTGRCRPVGRHGHSGRPQFSAARWAVKCHWTSRSHLRTYLAESRSPATIGADLAGVVSRA